MNENILSSKKVDQYAPRILKNWQLLASKVRPDDLDRLQDYKEIDLKPIPEVNKLYVREKSRFNRDILNFELQKVREEFLIEANKVEDKRMAMLESKISSRYESDLQDMDDEIYRIHCIINIQETILHQIYKRNKELFLDTLESAQVSEADLKMLAEYDMEVNK